MLLREAEDFFGKKRFSVGSRVSLWVAKCPYRKQSIFVGSRGSLWETEYPCRKHRGFVCMETE
jgi:hypothetical protein